MTIVDLARQRLQELIQDLRFDGEKIDSLPLEIQMFLDGYRAAEQKLLEQEKEDSNEEGP